MIKNQFCRNWYLSVWWMEFHIHRRIVGCTRIAFFLISAFPLGFLPLTAPASCLIRSQLQLRRLYFNWVDLPHAVLWVGRSAQATQFPLLTLCFAPTMLLVGYPAGFEQPHFLLLCFLPPMLHVWHQVSPSVFGLFAAGCLQRTRQWSRSWQPVDWEFRVQHFSSALTLVSELLASSTCLILWADTSKASHQFTTASVSFSSVIDSIRSSEHAISSFNSCSSASIVASSSSNHSCGLSSSYSYFNSSSIIPLSGSPSNLPSCTVVWLDIISGCSSSTNVFTSTYTPSTSKSSSLEGSSYPSSVSSSCNGASRFASSAPRSPYSGNWRISMFSLRASEVVAHSSSWVVSGSSFPGLE